MPWQYIVALILLATGTVVAMAAIEEGVKRRLSGGWLFVAIIPRFALFFSVGLIIGYHISHS